MEIVLGVGGSVAAYRAADLARDLMRAGAGVTALLTDGATGFVTPALFEALTGRPALVRAEEEPERGRMAHIDLARRADAILVAPITANGLAKLAHGIADDMLTTVVLASRAPLVLAPAMNPDMWASPSVRENVARLLDRGVILVGPVGGLVACGEEGTGKLAPLEEIVEATLAAAASSRAMAGKRVLITSGPTEEPLDDVRMLTNRSSGKMGAALVRAALAMGATVDVVAGPQRAPLPPGATIHRVRTAEEMLAAAVALAPGADLAVGAAAVADYRPRERFAGKRRRGEEPLSIELTPNPDVIAAVARLARRTVGFAAEPNPDLTAARAKLARKGLWAIVHNDVSAEGIGFDSDQNRVTLITENFALESARMGKFSVARWIFERIQPQE